ncbi:MAG: protoporphyrinogen/coproporphyrinogen oxidase [Thermoanaerobaculales bacterium]
MSPNRHLTVLGGGLAGLATAHFARKAGGAATVYEAESQPGGICRTFRWGEFLVDTGAHRLHDQDEEVTREWRALLGDHLERVEAPSEIWVSGKRLAFPLSVIDLIFRLGPRVCAQAGWDVVRERLHPREIENFEQLSLHRYGATLANLVLLNYSEKLWGVPCRELSPRASGKRLQGLSLASLLREAFLGRRGAPRHLEGAFYYPRFGIGELTSKLVESCGAENIRLTSRVSRVNHTNHHITGVAVNGGASAAVDRVVSTIPLAALVDALDPPAPAEIRRMACLLRSRGVIVVALFLSRGWVSANATTYFPGYEYPFTRVSEPINRSAAMAPPGHTSFVAEIPAQPEEARWRRSDGELVTDVAAALERLGWLRAADILGSAVVRLAQAYPLLTNQASEAAAAITAYLAGFENLVVAGRNGTHAYAFIHSVMREARNAAGALLADEQLASRQAGTALP